MVSSLTTVAAILVASSSFWNHLTAHAQSTVTLPKTLSGAAYTRTSTKFYILGGSDGTSDYGQFFYLNLTVPWTASQPAWTSLTDGLKQKIFPMTASKDESQLVVFHAGESSNPSDPLLAARLYSVTTGIWSTLQIQTTASSYQGFNAVTDLTTGLVYVAGSYNDVSRNSLDIFLFDNNTLQTVSLNAPPTVFLNRAYYANVWSKQLKSILYFGGYNRTLDQIQGPQASAVSRYTPADNSWRTLATTGTPPPPRADHCMATNEDGTKLVVFSGRTYTTPIASSGDIFVLDLVTFEWKSGTPGITRLYPACTVVGNQLIVWGGVDYQEKIPSVSMLIYNIDTGTWIDNYTPPDFLKPNAPQSTSLILSPGAIAGIAVGSMAVFSAVFLFLLHRRHRHVLVKNDDHDDDQTPLGPGNSSSPTSLNHPSSNSLAFSPGSGPMSNQALIGSNGAYSLVLGHQDHYELQQGPFQKHYQHPSLQQEQSFVRPPLAIGHPIKEDQGLRILAQSAEGSAAFNSADYGMNTLMPTSATGVSDSSGYVDGFSLTSSSKVTDFPRPLSQQRRTVEVTIMDKPNIAAQGPHAPVSSKDGYLITGDSPGNPHALVSSKDGYLIAGDSPGNPHTIIDP
ncbi:hypothetical protein BGW38_006717 [Lunasporangiospora selenospora]|uniref:Kelch motif-containing protein n=1 Tax=Lunasporangiospora selenospora TaxID=979761 RepID=A0A9P6FM96_9FUNG|nr:hypothetical protein BGW38_006717 [Lunasporangiospora selenospora]